MTGSELPDSTNLTTHSMIAKKKTNTATLRLAMMSEVRRKRRMRGALKVRIRRSILTLFSGCKEWEHAGIGDGRGRVYRLAPL